MTSNEIERDLDNEQGLISDWFAEMTTETILELRDAIASGEPIEHYFTELTADQALRWLSLTAILVEVRRRMEVADLEERLS